MKSPSFILSLHKAQINYIFKQTDDDVASCGQKLLDGLEADAAIAAGDDDGPPSLIRKI